MIKVVLFDYGRVLYGPLLPHRKVRKLAKVLREQGVKTGILSNVFSTAAWLINLTGGYRDFEPLILSFKEGIAKPEAKIYQNAVKASGVSPQEILFIDNSKKNTEAAKKAGMKTILAKSSGQVVADVKKLLLKENGLQL